MDEKTEEPNSISIHDYHPLFSSLITFHTIILIYFPNHFTKIVLSPVLISTGILLLALLRLGLINETQKKSIHNSTQKTQNDRSSVPAETGSDLEIETDFSAKETNFIETAKTNLHSVAIESIFDSETKTEQTHHNLAGKSEPGLGLRFGETVFNFTETERTNQYFVPVGSNSDPEFEPVPVFDFTGTEQTNQCFVPIETNSKPEFEPEPVFSTDTNQFYRETAFDFTEIEQTNQTNSEPEFESKPVFSTDTNQFYSESFVEWNVRAPLEIIYEEEEEEPNRRDERYFSMHMYYPESDTDSSSEGDFPATGDSPERSCFEWDEEDREALIEIELNGKVNSELFFNGEEDNLIEIDIFRGD